MYYDPKECGIGFHGDGERKKVVALRLGARMNLQYQWFVRSEPVGKRIEFFLDYGDLYAMREKASGNDWKKKIIPTLRHAAGGKSSLKSRKKRKRKLKRMRTLRKGTRKRPKRRKPKEGQKEGIFLRR